MPRFRHHAPTSRASQASVVLGIVSIALGVLAIAPVMMRWPASWPGLFLPPMLIGFGARVIARHIAKHRTP